MLGGLQLAPTGKVRLERKIGHRSIVAAGQAKPALMPLRRQPVAGIVGRILAKELRPFLPIKGAKASLIDVQGDEGVACRIVSQSATAAAANTVFEVQNISASLAGEEFHRSKIGRRVECNAVPRYPITE
jgi:hypothetical protein